VGLSILFPDKIVQRLTNRLRRGGRRVSQPLLIAAPRVVREPRMLSTCRAEAADFDPFEKKSCCLAQRTRARGPTKPTHATAAFRFCSPLSKRGSRPLARSGGGAHSAIWWRLKPWGRRAHGFSSARRIPSRLAVEALRSADLGIGDHSAEEEELLTAPRLCEMVRVLTRAPSPILFIRVARLFRDSLRYLVG